MAAAVHPPIVPMSTPSTITPVPPWLESLVHMLLSRSSLDSLDSADAPSPLAQKLANLANSSEGLSAIRHALHILRTRNPPGIQYLAQHTDAHCSLVAMIRDQHQVYESVVDKVAILVACHSLCNDKLFRNNFIAASGIDALCSVVTPQTTTDRTDRVVGTGIFAVAERNASNHRVSSSFDSHSLPAFTPPVHIAVWNAAIRTIAKLMVCSTTACAHAIDTGALALLATAAQQSQPMDIRLRAAAGLAAISAWSGPRRAVEIVETDGVVAAMTAILTDTDDRIPNHLRTATIDGLVVMSYRRHARRILQRHGTEEKIKAAARFATVSGDYTAAARSTVAAGQMTGRSIDEYGFLVEDPAEASQKQVPNGKSEHEHSGSVGDDEEAEVEKRPSALSHIQQQILEEPYTSVEDLNVLEEIVHEEAGVLSSSPRDRSYVRSAARSYGVSADEIEFMSILEESVGAGAANTSSSSPSQSQNQGEGVELEQEDEQQQQPEETLHDRAPTTASTAENGSEQVSPRRFSSNMTAGSQKATLKPSAFASVRESSSFGVVPPPPPPEYIKTERPGSGFSGTLTDLIEAGAGTPRKMSNLMQSQDPDFDRNLKDDEPDTASTATAPSSKSKITSPLLMFSSATKRAAEKGAAKVPSMQKTNSQLNRETEHERIWRDVLEEKPEILEREHGKNTRVVAYRELALVPVPSSLRRKLWPILLDTASLRATKPRLYEKLCKVAAQRQLPDDIEHTIDADVTRTMPLHALFWAGGAQVGVQSLRSILRAYAQYVPDVGYCQGMSSIAAVFLMNAIDEEEAFLMMAQFMNRFHYKRVFAPGFPLMLQWISELKPLVAHYMPELSSHLDRENVDMALYTDKWLITALSHNFPHRYLLRIWDLMFLGGSPRIILKVCLATLKRCETKLMTMDFERIMPFLQRGFAEPDANILDAKTLEDFITLARGFRFMSDINKARVKNGTAVSQGNSPTNQRRRTRRASCLPCFGRSETVD